MTIPHNEPKRTRYEKALDRWAMTPWELADPIFEQIAIEMKGKPVAMKAALAGVALVIRAVEALESLE